MPALRCAAAVLCVLAGVGPASSPAESAAAAPPGAPALRGCTRSGRGFLRARLRGALDLDLAWRDAEMHCDGGPRPDGRGLRITVAGPLQSDGRRLRFVFGIDGAPEGRTVRSRPTNVTLLFEGERRVFATRGDARCTTDELIPARVGALGGPRRSWQISARGFCTGPATALGSGERIVLTRFDLLTEVSFEDEPDAPRRPRTVLPEPDAGAAAVRTAGHRYAAGSRRHADDTRDASPATAARTVELPAGHASDRRG